MPVNFKSNNYDFLKKVGVSQACIDTLKKSGVKVTLGMDSVGFKNKSGEWLGNCPLGQNISTALKGVAGSSISSTKIENFIIETVIPSAAFGIDPSPLPEYVALMDPSPLVIGQPHVSSGVIALRDATAIYQQVKGTSANNYFVVALNKDVKLAVKLGVITLALRAEGNFTPEIVKAIEKAGLEIKTGKTFTYASQHYSCTDEAPTSHLLGALLTATELEFYTPFPSMKKLKKLAGIV